MIALRRSQARGTLRPGFRPKKNNLMSVLNNLSLQIREACEEDLSLLVSMARETFVENYEHLNDPIHFWDYVDAHLTEDAFLEEMHTEGSSFYLAYYAGVPAGYFKLNVPCTHTELTAAGPHLELARIYVKKLYQGLGIGQAMLRIATEAGAAAACTSVWLGVWQKNYAAVAWYKKQGFQVFGQTVFMMGADPQEDWLMYLTI